MTGKVLVSARDLSNILGTEAAVFIDTRDPAVYAEAHVLGAVEFA